jgi:hypothetical protein
MNGDTVIKKNDQVVYRHPSRSGTLIEQGSVIRVEEDGIMATVSFPTLNTIRTVPLSSLEKTISVFGQIRRTPSPAKTTVRYYMP